MSKIIFMIHGMWGGSWCWANYKSLFEKEFENHAHWVVAEPGWQDIAAYAKGWLKQVSPERH